MMWTNEQIAQWQGIHQQYRAETSSIEHHKLVSQQKLHAQQEMLQVLNTFLDSTISLREFNTIFQHKTRKTWSVFHLKGMSGGLFLNKLVKYVPNEDTFAHLLRMLLHTPGEVLDGQRHMQAFVQCLEEAISSQQAARWQLQPARVPFFLSVWWHIQEVEIWPIFYLELRRAIFPEGETLTSSQNSVATYFVFKSRFLALKQALDLSTWELEQLVLWHHSSSIPEKETLSPLSTSHKISLSSQQLVDATDGNQIHMVNTYASTVSRKGNIVYKKGQRETNHTYIQWLLAKIGLKIGCSVWIAIDDHEKMWNQEKLGDLSLPSLPGFADGAFEQIIQHIDVLWLRKNEIIAAYEIELTTVDISKSLLRLSDLAVLLPKRDVQFCVVTPQRCFDAVQSELSRPIFQDHDIHRRSKVIIQEHLVQNAEHILRWASNPSVVQDLTLYLSAKEQ